MIDSNDELRLSIGMPARQPCDIDDDSRCVNTHAQWHFKSSAVAMSLICQLTSNHEGTEG